MRFSLLKRIEKIVVIALVCMTALSIVLLWMWLVSEKSMKESQVNISRDNQITSAADTSFYNGTNYLPDKYTLNQDVSDLSFKNENGRNVTVAQMRGKVLVLNFWTSWCPYCRKELEGAAEMKAMLSRYTDVEYLLVDKLEPSRETKEQAQAYLKENNIPFNTVFDENSAVYVKLGLKVVPTTLVIDRQGVLRAWHAGEGMDSGVLQAMIDYTLEGGSSGVLNFIENQLTNKAGGIRTNYVQEKGSQLKYTDVLSESQGLLMEYALLAKNRELFERSYNYLSTEMQKDPLAAWVVTDKGPSRVNSALDDLRIYRVLSKADELWGGYDGKLSSYEKMLRRYNTNNQRLINQYDFKYRKKSDKLKLCFADFEALKALSTRHPSWEKVYDNALSTVEKGYISDAFPLHYPEYDYSKKEYAHEDINMAEEMVTLLHLAKLGKLRPETLAWLKNSVEGEGVFAKYKTDGTVAAGHRYESTAIYGLIGMTAGLAGDTELANKAFTKMEAMRVFDSAKQTNGAFGNPDGTGIYSFDQCIALLTYGKFEESDG